MNLLFVNYGDFTTNSLNHIGGFAGWLTRQGHSCIVAVPDGLDTLSAIDQPAFTAATYTQVLDGAVRFADGRPADVLHAWTPRECVRRFILAHQRLTPSTRLIVHLEDNEEHLTAAFANRPLAELAGLTDDELSALLPDRVSHPRRYRQLLALADAATVIVARLSEFVPRFVSTHELPPGIDFSLYHPQPPDNALRRSLGLAPNEKIIVYTGSTTFANAPAMRQLLGAVHLLRERGHAVRLVRTGFHPEEFTRDCAFDWKRFTLDAGFVSKTKLPQLLALADVLVQPGQPGAFDDFRLPSKLPEFLASGKPVVLPAANIGHELVSGQEAIVLPTADATAIADACERLFHEPVTAAKIGAAGNAWAQTRFGPDRIGAGLLSLYKTVLAQPPRASWAALKSATQTESLLLALMVGEAMKNQPLALATELLAGAIAAAEETASRTSEQTLREKLECELAGAQAKLALTEKHAANLAEELHEARRGFDELRTWATQRTQELEDLVQHREKLAVNFQAELVRLTREFEAECVRLRGQIAEGENRVRRMKNSFSWRATAPLRAARRQFLDSSIAEDTPAECAAPPTPPNESEPKPRCKIDEPRFWHVPAGPLTIRGWCLLPDGSTAKRVRLVEGEREVFGLAGLPRNDVAAILETPAASRSGFQIDWMIDPGIHHVRLEFAGADERWWLALQTDVIAFAPLLPAAVDSYEQWLHLYERHDGARLAAQRAEVQALQTRPLISVLMPVYNSPECWLRRAIESVLEQTYDRWELCIADDKSTAAHVRLVLQEFAARDARIKVVFRDRNGHISRASNSALELATGEYLALLDHDDELAPDALSEVALALMKRPDADVLYSDEDKIDVEGRRFSPYFKPDFLPDLFRGQNYLTHLAVYRAPLVREVGGFRPGFEGSQDWDLALRVIDRTTPERVVHIPKVLYHWRAIPGSTALTIDQKNYHVAAARRALEEHLARTARPAELLPVPGDHWRIRYRLPAERPLVSLLIPTRNGVRHLRRCLESIWAKTTYSPLEILVVDNGSDDPATQDFLRDIAARPNTRVLSYPYPFNYSAINNFAAREARGTVLGLLNDDLEVITSDWLEEMVSHALRPEIGCVGAMLYYPDELIQHAGVLLGIGGVAGHAFKKLPRGTDGFFNRARLVQNYSAVTAACLLIRKTTFEQVGGLDERELAVAFNDVDFCLKVRAAGYWNLWTPFAEFYHHESASRGPENTPEKQARFRREVELMRARWGTQLENDPAYNPNLSLDSEQIALASPPRLAAAVP